MERSDKPLQDIKTYKYESTAPSSGDNFRGNIYFEFEVPIVNVHVHDESYAIIEMTADKNAALTALDITNDGFENDIANALFTEQIFEVNGVEVDKIKYPWHSNMARVFVTDGHEITYRNSGGSLITVNSSSLTKKYDVNDSLGVDYIVERNFHQMYNGTTKKIIIVLKNCLFKKGANLWGNNRLRYIYKVDPEFPSSIYVGALTPTYSATGVDTFARFYVDKFNFYSVQYQALEEPVNKVYMTDYERIFPEQRILSVGTKTTEFDLPIEPSTIRSFSIHFSSLSTNITTLNSTFIQGTLLERFSVNYKNTQYPREEYYFGDMVNGNEIDVQRAYNDYLNNTEFIHSSSALSFNEWRTLFPIFFFRVFEESDSLRYRSVLHFKMTFKTALTVNTLMTVVPYTRYSFEQQYNSVGVPSRILKIENVSHVPNKTGIQLDREDEIREEEEAMET